MTRTLKWLTFFIFLSGATIICLCCISIRKQNAKISIDQTGKVVTQKESGRKEWLDEYTANRHSYITLNSTGKEITRYSPEEIIALLNTFEKSKKVKIISRENGLRTRYSRGKSSCWNLHHLRPNHTLVLRRN